MKKIALFSTLLIGGLSALKAQTLSSSSSCPGSSLVVTSPTAPTRIVWQRGGVGVYTATPGFSPDANTVAGNGVDGNGPDQLSSPQGVWVDGSGAVYVADYGNSRVQKWEPGATTGVTVAGTGIYGSNAEQLSYPIGLCVDGSGNVYVTDVNNNRIQKWAPGATSGVTVAGDGTAGSGPSQLDQPYGVCVDASGNVYVADAGNNRIQKWAPGASSGTTVAGTGVSGSGASQLSYPLGVCVWGGYIYIADNFNNRIQKWALGASAGTTVAGYIDRPSVVQVDNYGNLYTDDLDANGIRKWTPGATSGILVAGTGGYGSGTDQLASPSAVYVDGIGQIYVSDNINNRIQKFGPSIVTTLTATTGGNYTAVVTIGGTNTITNNVTINAATTAGIITGQANVAVGSTTILTDAVAGGTWSASNEKVTVANGSVTGVSNGSATISYTTTDMCGTATATKLVSVGTTTLTAAPITGYSFNLCEGATVQYFDATTGGTWGINPADIAVASVSGSGLVLGLNAGTGRLTYTLGSSYNTVVITVNPAPAAITGTGTVCQGLTTGLADVTPGGVWSSGIPSTATVGSTGLVSATNTGIVPIYYTISATSCRATFLVTINPNPTAITGPVKVCAGNSITLSDATAGGAWSGTNAYATVDGAGNVVGLAAGSVDVTYSLVTGCVKVLHVPINQVPAAISGNLTVCTGSKTYLSDAITPAVSWTSSAPAFATVTASGAVTGIAAGTAIVTYTLANTCWITAVVTVNPTPSVTSILGASTVSNGGAGITLSDLTINGVWTSNNPAVLTVNNTGSVTAHVSAGSAYISYTITNSFACSSYAAKSVSCTPPVGGRVRGTTDSTIAATDGTELTITTTDLAASDNGEAANIDASVTISRLPMTVALQPNPNNGNFRIKGSAGTIDAATVTIEVTNMMGQVVHTGYAIVSGGVIDQQIALESLPNGSYLLNIKNGVENKVVRFIIAK